MDPVVPLDLCPPVTKAPIRPFSAYRFGVWLVPIPILDTRPPKLQALSIMQQADHTHQCSSEPQQHVDQENPSHLLEFDVILPVTSCGVGILDLILSSEPPEYSAPDDEEDSVPDEGNGDRVVIDKSGYDGECDGGNDAETTDCDGERDFGLPLL